MTSSSSHSSSFTLLWPWNKIGIPLPSLTWAKEMQPQKMFSLRSQRVKFTSSVSALPSYTLVLTRVSRHNNWQLLTRYWKSLLFCCSHNNTRIKGFISHICGSSLAEIIGEKMEQWQLRATNGRATAWKSSGQQVFLVLLFGMDCIDKALNWFLLRKKEVLCGPIEESTKNSKDYLRIRTNIHA